MWIVRGLVIYCVALCLTACGNDDSAKIQDQTTYIERFLEENLLEYDQPGGVYRHFGARGDQSEDVLNNGDNVQFSFELYPAQYTRQSGSLNPLAPVTTTAIYSNKSYVIDTLRKKGLDVSYWSAEPFRTSIGSSELTKGLNRGLEGCRKGDSVLLFLTSDLAMGNKPISNIPANTAVLYIVNIE